MLNLRSHIQLKWWRFNYSFATKIYWWTMVWEGTYGHNFYCIYNIIFQDFVWFTKNYLIDKLLKHLIVNIKYLLIQKKMFLSPTAGQVLCRIEPNSWWNSYQHCWRRANTSIFLCTELVMRDGNKNNCSIFVQQESGEKQRYFEKLDF